MARPTLLLLALAACGGSQSGSQDSARMSKMDSEMEEGMGMPGDPESQFGPLEVGADWASYTKVNTAAFPSPTHGGRMVDVYVNPVGLEAYLGGDTAEIPVGTVIVKTSMEKSGAAGPVFVMEKRADDWWYAIHWADPPEKWAKKLGGPIYWRTPSPRAEYCSDCHDGYERGLGGVPEEQRVR
jgi:hypothetical protein